MKKILLSVLCCLLTFWGYAVKPGWTTHTPTTHGKKDYLFVVEHATGASEEEAVNKAIGLVYKWAIAMYGAPMSSKQVDELVNSGSISDSQSFDFDIPIHRVAQYTKVLKNGGYKVFLLYQVAVAGVIDPDWEDSKMKIYTSGTDGNDVVDVVPDEWEEYETDEYFSVVLQDDLQKKDEVNALKNSLQEKAKNKLVQDVHLDGMLLPLIHTDANANKEACCAVAYIESDAVVKQYKLDIESAMDVAETYISKADRDIKTKNLANAKAALDIAQDTLKRVEPKIKFLHAFATDRSIESIFEDSKDIKSKVENKYNSLSGNYTQVRENKIKEFIKTGKLYERDFKIGDALRYLYGAQLLLYDLETKESFEYTIHTPSGDSIVIVPRTFLDNEIKTIIEGISVTVDGTMPNDPTRVRLSFTYNRKTRKRTINGSIKKLRFRYSDGQNWSDWYQVRDGVAIIDLLGYKPQELPIEIDYRSDTEEGGYDVEVKNNMGKYSKKIKYDASISTALNNSVFNANQNTATSTISNVKNTYASRFTDISVVSDAEKKTCETKVLQVCKAIKNNNYASVRGLFTMAGYSQFDKLIKFGKAKVIATDGLAYFRIGDEIQCRSIPMEFVFSSGNKTRENVAFTFNSDKYIDGVQFTLEAKAQNDILGDKRISESARLSVLNFMENYKTAFSLKDIKYIESIFSDNAVIITGRKLVSQGTNEMQLGLNKKYEFKRYNKQQYIDNLSSSFKSKDWIKLEFGSTKLSMSKNDNMFAINLFQEYMSSNYGDRGYLFLYVDASTEYPKIIVRTWEAETGEKAPYDLDQYYKDTGVY